jgi:hypothetical protein
VKTVFEIVGFVVAGAASWFGTAVLGRPIRHYLRFAWWGDYFIREVRGDGYSEAWVETAFQDQSINYRRSELKKSQLYLEALPLFTRGAISIPDHAALLRELRLLERATHRGGKVQEPYMRVNTFDDLAVEFKHKTQHAVGRRMLRPEIDGEIA